MSPALRTPLPFQTGLQSVTTLAWSQAPKMASPVSPWGPTPQATSGRFCSWAKPRAWPNSWTAMLVMQAARAVALAVQPFGAHALPSTCAAAFTSAI